MTVSPPAAVTAFLIMSLAIVTSSGRGMGQCTSRADVESRVGSLSGRLQEFAAQGKIDLQALANATRRINDAEISFGQSGNYGAHCLALDAIGAGLASNGDEP